MVKTQVYLPEHELEALHRVAEQRGESVATLIRFAVTETWLRRTAPSAPVALWDGDVDGSSQDHDGVYDEP